MKASKLKMVRVERRLKVKDIASMIGISPCYLSLIENKYKPITPELLVKLANVYGFNPSELVD